MELKGHQPRDTITEMINELKRLKKVEDFVINFIEGSDLIDVMTAYSPTVQIVSNVSMDNVNVPKNIMEIIEGKYYEKVREGRIKYES